MPIQNTPPVQRALAHFDGSPTKMAAAIGAGVLRQHVEHWLKSGRIPTEHCRAVHDLTSVKCWDLRPDDWTRIWPDLIGSKGAPKLPATIGAKPNPDLAHGTAAKTPQREQRDDRRDSEPRNRRVGDQPSNTRGR